MATGRLVEVAAVEQEGVPGPAEHRGVLVEDAAARRPRTRSPPAGRAGPAPPAPDRSRARPAKARRPRSRWPPTRRGRCRRARCCGAGRRSRRARGPRPGAPRPHRARSRSRGRRGRARWRRGRTRASPGRSSEAMTTRRSAPRPDRQPGVAVDRHRQHVAVVVVGVAAHEVHPSRAPGTRPSAGRRSAPRRRSRRTPARGSRLSVHRRVHGSAGLAEGRPAGPRRWPSGCPS